MKKKTIVFLCLALLFLIAVPECFSSSLLTGIICIGLCGLFAFLAYRSFIMPKTDTASVVNSPNGFNPSQNKINNSDTPFMPNPTPPVEETIATAPSNFIKKDEIPDIESVAVSTPANVPEEFEYMEIKVAGVTFKNEKGPTRQTLLKKIKQHDAPFDEYLEISINQYEFEGELAYSICVNDRQIGNVPKSQVQYLYDNIERFVAITGINVYGGYRDENGYFKSYGAAITVKFRLSDNS